VTLTIRPAQRQDLGALERLCRQVDDEHARRLPSLFRSGPRSPGSMTAALAGRGQVLLVAEARGAIAGMCHVQLYDTPDAPTMVKRRRAYVEELVVDAPERRRGIGRALMARAAEWARGEGARELVLTVWRGNRAAEQFYAALGYEELSRVLSKPL
jgi:ribosomal protein S18 acetylase RimI-like enzyme